MNIALYTLPMNYGINVCGISLSRIFTDLVSSSKALIQLYKQDHTIKRVNEYNTATVNGADMRNMTATINANFKPS